MTSVGELELAAARTRRLILRMLEACPRGHVGGALSAVEIVTALYEHGLRIDPTNPHAAGRDRFLLSAGHKALVQYAALALAGFFPHGVLDTYGSFGSPVPGHPDMAKLPGVEANTGALGHGLAIACGMALGARLHRSTSRVFVVMGDGELPEGSNWEGAAIAAHHGLDAVTVVVDANGLQISGSTQDVMSMESITGKFAAFGWATAEVDGHDLAALVTAIDSLPLIPGRPSVIVARTVKGKGVSSIEGDAASHYWKPTPDQLADAIVEVDRAVGRLELAAAR